MSDQPLSAAWAVDVRHLTFSYNGTVTCNSALHDVSLTVAPGQCVGLIGPNGAGKSTLLLHLNGVLPEKHRNEGDQSSGVWIHGKPVTGQNLRDIRREVGLLFQDPDDQLFCPTVFEDIAFGPQQWGLDAKAVKQRVAQAMADMGLSGFENRNPQKLSGGEKRRVCLAGILACEPLVLALDEPTSNLDPRGRREFKQLLSGLTITRLIATHDLELVLDLCSSVVLLDRGRIITSGPTAQILSDGRLMFHHGLEVPASLRPRA